MQQCWGVETAQDGTKVNISTKQQQTSPKTDEKFFINNICNDHGEPGKKKEEQVLTAQPARLGNAPGCPRPPAPCPGGTGFWPAAPHSC